MEKNQTDDFGATIPIVIDTNRQSVVRGRVLGKDGLPLPNVKISIKAHPQYGQTFSRTDGWYDLAVEGGGGLVVDYTKTNYLHVQRQAQMAWNEYAVIDDVILDTPQEQSAQSIPISTISQSVTHVSPINSAPDGTQKRGAILIFPPGVTANATSKLASLPSASLDSLNVKTHEYTRDINATGTLLQDSTSIPNLASTSPTGRLAMPGELPPSSAYTYAIDLLDDAQLSDDTMSISFPDVKPVLYLDNFLGMKVGSVVPVGSYNRDTASWSAEANGIVVKLVAMGPGTVRLDIDSESGGDPGAESADELKQAFGLTNDAALNNELAALYSLATGSNPRLTVGSTLWRASIAHFSSWDLNFGYGPRPCNADPSGPCPDDSPGSVTGSGRSSTKLGDCEKTGSRISCDSHVVGEEIPVAGSGFSLVYSSDRVPGYAAERKLHIEFPAQNNDAIHTKDRVMVSLDVLAAGHSLGTVSAGQGTNHGYDFAPVTATDAYGRAMTGSFDVSVLLTEWYRVYAAAGSSAGMEGPAFATATDADINQPSRDFLKVRRSFKQRMSFFDSRMSGLGGWDLSIHHWYDATSQTLYRGDGKRVQVGSFSESAYMVDRPIHGQLMAQNNCGVPDGTPAADLGANVGSDIAIAPNGDLFISNPSPGCVYSVSKRNKCTQASDTPCSLLVAGGGTALSTSTGPIPIPNAPFARSVQFYNPIRAIRIGPDGSLYIGEANTYAASNGMGPLVHRVTPAPDPSDPDQSRITANSKLGTIAGNGSNSFSGDFGPATSAGLGNGLRFALSVGSNGNVYVLSSDPTCAGVNQSYSVRLRYVSPDGNIHPLVGGGTIPLNDFTGPTVPQAGTAFSCFVAVEPHIAAMPNGDVYTIGQYYGSVLHGDGRFEHLWTSQTSNLTIAQDGVLATAPGAFQGDSVQDFGPIASASDGSLYISEYATAKRVRRIDPQGIVSTVVSGRALNSDASVNSNFLVSFDANHTVVPALRVREFDDQQTVPGPIAVAPNGDIYVLLLGSKDGYGPSILRAYKHVSAAPGCASYIPSEDGSEVYCFDASGRHLNTFDGHLMANGARTLKHSFQYDTDDPNKLIGVTDADGNVVSIGHASGNVQIVPAIGSTLAPTTIYTDPSTGFAQRVETPGVGIPPGAEGVGV